METLQEIPEESNEDSEKSNCSSPKLLTPYEKVLQTITDPKLSHEIGISRIGIYKFCGEIGKGNFSRVKKATHLLTKDKVAVKIVDRSRLDSRNLQMLSREVATLESLSLHPHILRLFEVIETIGRVHLVTELIEGGELYYYIVQHGLFAEHKAAKIFKQIASAVQYIHHLGFVHRDIKAENVLLISDEHVKLCDFGFSTQVKSSVTLLLTFCGSPPYAPPELFQEESYLGKPIDVWSLGILLYFILTANMPFTAPSISQLKGTILKGEYNLPGTLSQSCVKLVQCILLHHPLHRPNIDQILGCEWIQLYSAGKSEIQDVSEARVIIQKRKSFWCTSRSRRTSPLLANQTPKQPEIIKCYTKKYNNVPTENFRNPLEAEMLLVTSSSIKTMIPIHNISTFKRNNSLINSSKIVSKKSIPYFQNNNNDTISEERSLNDKSSNDDIDFEPFMMIPTRTNSGLDLTRSSLHPIEQEARKIMNTLGIENAKIESEITNAPHSQIIGIYRILIHRLIQKRDKREKSPPTKPIQSVKKKKKRNALCTIL